MISKQRWAVRTGGALALAGSICFAGMGATMAAEPLRLTALQSVKTNILATGQTKCWQGVDPYAEIDCAATGQDGEYQMGLKPGKKGRFKDNGNGTVEDLLTGLIWLKDASCDELGPNGDGSVNWQGALEAANALAEGQCGLTDKSKLGDWRLPNVNELLSLIDREFVYPALSNAAGNGQWTEGDAFSGVQGVYWSSTSYVGNPEGAWAGGIVSGQVGGLSKNLVSEYVWPVRGGKGLSATSRKLD